MGEFPSGQRGQTVNLLRIASMVRIRPPPPKSPRQMSTTFLTYTFELHSFMQLSVHFHLWLEQLTQEESLCTL